MSEQPQPSRNWFARHKVLTGLGAVVAVVVIGSAAGASGRSNRPAAPTVPASSAPAPTAGGTTATPDAGPRGDVKITGCHIDPDLNFASASVTITNRSSKPSNYIVQIEFTDSHGTRLDEGTAATNNLAPGQAAKETAQGTTEVHGTITCRVTDVTRYAS